jgi:hypothetical protein
MILDQGLIVCDDITVRGSDPDYSSAIDMTLSPDFGSGSRLCAVITCSAYTIGSSTSTTINIVTSASSTLSTPKTIGSLLVLAADWESRDAVGLDIAAVCAPIVVWANPQHEIVNRDANPITGVTERYLGLEFDHATTPTVLTVTAYFTTDYQGDPHNAYFAPGMTVV